MVLFVLVLFFSCKKEECLEGTVRLSNNSNNPYEVYIDGQFVQVIAGKSFVEYPLREGNRVIRVVQQSGFILFPTDVKNTIAVFGCMEHEWIFP